MNMRDFRQPKRRYNWATMTHRELGNACGKNTRLRAMVENDVYDAVSSYGWIYIDGVDLDMSRIESLRETEDYVEVIMHSGTVHKLYDMDADSIITNALAILQLQAAKNA